MEDLGEALNSSQNPIMMGGGNPAVIPQVQACFAKHLACINQDSELLNKLLAEYQPPQGNPDFLAVLADYLNHTLGWNITAKNIAVTNGAQSAFFTLFNFIVKASSARKICMPLVPDYLGYVDLGVEHDMFTAFKPVIKTTGEKTFKYEIDRQIFDLEECISAVCFSRPTNPSGNIISDDEVEFLAEKTLAKKIPLIFDLAYGQPFPAVTFSEHSLPWFDHAVYVMSLSKLGLPGARTGIVVADENTIDAVTKVTATLALAPGNLGPSVATQLIQSGDLERLKTAAIYPYYQRKMQQAFDYCLEKSKSIPVNIHQPEGAFFLWLWFEGLPISSEELYQRLKAKGVFIISGHHFFQALNDEQWPHQNECIRVSYCQDFEKVKQGLDIVFDEVNRLFNSPL